MLGGEFVVEVRVDAGGYHADERLGGEVGYFGFVGGTNLGENVGVGVDLRFGEDRGAGGDVGCIAEGGLFAS